jgi:hypothetical protein
MLTSCSISLTRSSISSTEAEITFRSQLASLWELLYSMLIPPRFVRPKWQSSIVLITKPESYQHWSISIPTIASLFAARALPPSNLLKSSNTDYSLNQTSPINQPNKQSANLERRYALRASRRPLVCLTIPTFDRIAAWGLNVSRRLLVDHRVG